MKSDAHRKLVVAKVNEQFALFRSFTDLPVVKIEAENRFVVLDDIITQSAYVDALFRLFDLDPGLRLLGREGSRVVSG